MEILLATGNPHKREELSQILRKHKLLIPKELGIDFDPIENGSNFQQNSLIKALELHRLTGHPTIADDSGIAVKALNGAPGIYSARYGEKEMGKSLNSFEKNQLLLSKLKGVTNRDAAFICCMTLLINENQFYSVQESWNGQIAMNIEGEEGFGYDPIFYLPKKKMTVAQLGNDEKNQISHRAKAGKMIAKLLEIQSSL